MSGPRLGALSKNRWSGGTVMLKNAADIESLKYVPEKQNHITRILRFLWTLVFFTVLQE